MAAITLAELRANAQLLSDLRTATVISSAPAATAEWTKLINDGYRELYHEVIAANPDFRVKTQTVTITSTATNYAALTNDFFETRGMCRDFGLISEEWLSGSPMKAARRDCKRSYRLQDINIFVEPYTLSVGTYAHFYNPDLTPLAADANGIDAELNRWSSFIELHAAIAAKAIVEDDPSALLLKLNGANGQPGIRADVRKWAEKKRMADPLKIEDVRPRRRGNYPVRWP